MNALFMGQENGLPGVIIAGAIWNGVTMLPVWAMMIFAHKLRRFPPKYHVQLWTTGYHTDQKTVWCPNGSQYPEDGKVIVHHIRITEYRGLDKNGKRCAPRTEEFTDSNVTNAFDKTTRPSVVKQCIQYLQLKKHDYIALMHKSKTVRRLP